MRDGASGPEEAILIDLYFWPTPNGWKVSILLEELGIPYRVIPVDIGRGEQFAPDFLAVSPNNRIPAIVDREPEGGGDPIAIFESGAILLYLAEKTGRLVPEGTRGRFECLKWLFWQVGGLGPMAGQAHHFRLYARESIPYAVERYTNECARLYGVLDRRLEGRPFLAGDYSVADVACFPWALGHERQGVSLEELPNLARWLRAVEARPAVARGLEVGKELRPPKLELDDEARRVLFEQKPPGRGG